MTAHTQDDGFHEIQLNGKQLVFLFMAATVVSVVIFLCGVLVGRGVRVERSAEADAAGLSAAAEPTPPRAASRDADSSGFGSDRRRGASTVDDLSYFDRLQASNPSPEQLKAPEKPLPSLRASQPPLPRDRRASACRTGERACAAGGGRSATASRREPAMRCRLRR